MSNIEENLKKILGSVYGKDVRQAIHDSIHDCYEDGKTGAVDLIAREQIANLVANSGDDTKDSELVDARVGYDGTVYKSAGESIRGQISSIDNKKVELPIDNPYGKNGQLLRTNGNGITEWVDEGLPTDDQTANAINQWLDKHPEATTTVQDGSIEEIKFTDELRKKKASYYNYVKDMLSDVSLTEGMTAVTLGYYELNDGGHATYLIRKKNDNDENDGGSIHFLSSESLVAELIVDNGIINVKQFGAKGDGETDDTNAIQKSIDFIECVLIPEGVYNISSITLRKESVLQGCGWYSTVLKSSEPEYCVYIPKESDHVILSDMKITSGLSIGIEGNEATVQDLNCRITNVSVFGGLGVLVGHRGNILDKVSVSEAKKGIVVHGTDNAIKGCTVAVIDGSGFATDNANNLFESCKAFVCGNNIETQGKGFIISGAFSRLIGCEAQQNLFENYYFKNSHGTIVSGCISDGAWWRDSEVDNYENNEFGTIEASSVFIHNCIGAMFDFSIINGSIFNERAGVCKYAIYERYQGMSKKTTINFVKYDRNGHTSELINTTPSNAAAAELKILNPEYNEKIYDINPYLQNAEILSGGYSVLGNMCFVNVKIKILESFSYTNSYAYVPKPLYPPIVPCVCDNKDVRVRVNQSGEIIIDGTTSKNMELNISACYAIKNYSVE